jgi:hypothetical protein
MKTLQVIIGVALMALIGGCSEYVDGYRYGPGPVLAGIPATQPGQAPPAAVLVSVIGVRRADEKADLPLSIEVRMRVDDNTAEDVVFEPATLQMTNRDLIEFAPPILTPRNPFHLTPRRSEFVTAYFPLPAGKSYDQVDLESLQLRWLIQVDGRQVGQVAEFQRTFRYYYYYDDPNYWDYPYYYPYRFGFYYGGGVGIRHRR